MACVRKRRGKYVADWRDGAGVRHWKSFDKKGDADTFRDHVGPQVVVGLYRATADAPPQLFYAHRDHVHVAAQIAIADSVLVGHRGFPLLLDTADRICAAEFGGRRLEVAVQQVYAKLDLPYRYLGERETRR